jgi:hypothetical protein
MIGPCPSTASHFICLLIAPFTRTDERRSERLLRVISSALTCTPPPPPRPSALLCREAPPYFFRFHPPCALNFAPHSPTAKKKRSVNHRLALKLTPWFLFYFTFFFSVSDSEKNPETQREWTVARLRICRDEVHVCLGSVIRRNETIPHQKWDILFLYIFFCQETKN